MRDREFESWMKEHWMKNSNKFHNSPFYLASCAQGEAGEIFKVIKKAVKIQETNYPILIQEEKDDLVEEIGDTMHYCIRLGQQLDVDIETIFGRNYTKLIMRYGE